MNCYGCSIALFSCPYYSLRSIFYLRKYQKLIIFNSTSQHMCITFSRNANTKYRERERERTTTKSHQSQIHSFPVDQMTMKKEAPELAERSSSNPKKPHHIKPHRPTLSPFSFYSPKLSFYILSACVTLFVILHIQTLQTDQNPTSSSWSLKHQWQRVTNTTATMAEKLRQAVTFLPLKDLRYAGPAALQGHTWFMSSMYDKQDEEGGVQYQQFPSPSSHGRLLCLKGRDNHDGSWNSYALAFPEALPHNTTLMKGLTFVSYNHYNYDNIWHGLSAVVPFVSWHIKSSCAVPDRWVLYHWGEIRARMGVWLGSLMEATFNGAPRVEVFDDVEEGRAVCFEKAVVMRHNEGGMSREKRLEVYDQMRCKARLYCNVSLDEQNYKNTHSVTKRIGVTLFMRTGPRSFKNDTAVIGIFERECAKVDGCRLMVAYSNNLTFCDQVRICIQIFNHLTMFFYSSSLTTLMNLISL